MSQITAVRMFTVLMLAGLFCSAQCTEPPRLTSRPTFRGPLPLTLEFESLQDEYERGVVALTLRVSNYGSTPYTIDPRHDPLGPNSVMIYIRRKIDGQGVGQFTHCWDPERLTPAGRTRQVLPAEGLRIFTARTILDVPPGKYQLMAYLKVNKDIRTGNEIIKIKSARDGPKEEL